MKLKYTKATCAICKHTSIHNEIEYTQSNVASDLDTRAGGVYKKAFYNDVFNCPYCNYSATNIGDNILPKGFDIKKDPTYLSIIDSEIDIIARKFLLYAYINEVKERYELAFINYLKASWRYCDNGEKRKVKKSREKMYESFKKLGSDASNTICLIMIDTLRKNDEFEDAKKIAKNTFKTPISTFYKRILLNQLDLISKKDNKNYNLSNFKAS